nr:hypothetical protein [Deltaproteobacteria bacterium]
MNRPESSNTPLEPTVELSLSNVQIHVTVSWWGFEVHLNEDATQLLEDIRDLAAKLAKYLDPELAPVITAAMLVEKLWIKAVDRGNGVRLVSPWISPTMLIPWPEDEVEHVDDNSLYWSVYDSTNGWSDDHRFPASYAEVGPAVADYDGRLVCVHRGPSADSYLFCTTHDADRGWTRDQRMPQHTTEAEPALAELDGLLYCVHRGDGNDIDLWWTCFDGTGWSDARVLPQSLSSSGPALAQFQGRLHCVHRGAEDDNLWWTTFDGTSWEDGRKLPLHT